MSSNYEEEKYKEEQDRLNKDLEDAKSAEEKQRILMAYEEENIKKIKLLHEQNERLAREMEEIYNNIMKNDTDKY
jgi:hypothetical protein